MKLFAHAERERRIRARGHGSAHRPPSGLAAQPHRHGVRALFAERSTASCPSRAWRSGCGASTTSPWAPSPSTLTLAIRIIAMSGWILFTVAGIFENIGVVQEGMQTISARLRHQGSPRCQAACRQQRRDRFRGRALPLRQREKRHPGRLAHHQAGREGWPRGPLRRRQVDARQRAAALLRPRGRAHPHRWPGYLARHAG